MKETFYFSHDYTAHTDPKIEKIIYDIGWNAYGLYWAIIEKLALEGGLMEKDYKRLAFILHTDEEILRRIIEDYNLFVVDKKVFSSQRLTEHLEKRKVLSDAGKRGVAIREANKKKQAPHKAPLEALKESKGKISAKAKKPKTNKEVQAHIEIIDTLITVKGIHKAADFTYKKYQAFIKRNTKLASELVKAGYDIKYIIKTMLFCTEHYDDWKLEAVSKNIDEVSITKKWKPKSKIKMTVRIENVLTATKEFQNKLKTLKNG